MSTTYVKINGNNESYNFPINGNKVAMEIVQYYFPNAVSLTYKVNN